MHGFTVFFTNILDYALVIQILSVSFSVVIVLSPVQKNVRSVAFALLKAAGFFGSEVLICAFLFALAEYIPILRGNCFLFGYILCIGLYAVFFCKYQYKVRLIMASTVLAISVTVLEFGPIFAKLFETLFAESVPVDWMGIIKSVASLFVLCFAVIQAKFSMSKYDDIPVSATVLIVCCSGLSAVMCFVYEGFFAGMGRPDIPHLVFTGLIFATLYVIDIATYMLIFFVCRERDAVIRLKAEKQMAEASAEMVKLSEKNLNYLRQLKHDIGNQYAYAEMLLENGQYEDAKKFFRSIGGDMILSLSYVDSGNKNIDAIINMEISKANAYDVAMDVKVVVPPALPFSDSALCSIISNLVDNAIEACIRYDMRGPGVSVQIYPRHDYLYIGVENTLPADIDKERLTALGTSKPDAANHGYGTQIVKRLVAQYNGYVTYSVDGNKFVAEAMMNLMDDTARTGGGLIYEKACDSNMRRRRDRAYRYKGHAVRHTRKDESPCVGGRVRVAAAPARSDGRRRVRPGVPGYRNAGYGRDRARTGDQGKRRRYGDSVCVQSRRSGI